MTGELFTRITTNETERKEIAEAIVVMEQVIYAYEKTGMESVRFLIEDLQDGISALKGVLEKQYY